MHKKPDAADFSGVS